MVSPGTGRRLDLPSLSAARWRRGGAFMTLLTTWRHVRRLAYSPWFVFCHITLWGDMNGRALHPRLGRQGDRSYILPRTPRISEGQSIG